MLDAIALTLFVFSLCVLGGCKTIPEGKSSVNELQVRGADAVDEDEIKDKIATTETTKFLMLFRGILFEYSLFDRFVLDRDLLRLQAFYRSKGYYDVHVRAGRVFTLDDKHVRVEIIVEEGPPVVVHSVRLEGIDGLPERVVKSAKAEAASGLPAEKPFVDEDFKTTEGNVRRALTDRGYAYAKVKSDAAVDIVTHRVDVVMTVTPGPKCTFGDVTIDGLGGLPVSQIRRTVDISPGDPYSEKTLEDAQQALLDLGVFASVELDPDLPGTDDSKDAGAGAGPNADGGAPANADGGANVDGGAPADADGDAGAGEEPPPPAPLKTVIPVHVKLETSRLRTIKLGVGVEFDSLKTDVHGLIGWENKNFYGNLRTFSVQFRPGVVLYPMRVSKIVAPNKPLLEERLRLELAQPSFLEARTKGFVRPEFNIYPVLINPDPLPDERVIGYGELRNSIGLERTWWKLYGAISYNTQVAYPFAYVNDKDPTLGLVVISYPELALSLDFRDDKLHPTKGIFLGSTFQVAGQIFGGSASDFKVQPEVRLYVPLYKSTKRKLIFATRGSVGFLEASNYGQVVQNGPSGATTPESAERTKDYQITFFRGFFSGGPNQNRGYPLRGVGPYDIVPFLTPDTAAGQINSECLTNQGANVDDRCRSPTGGFTLWEASAELRYGVTGPLSVAGFCDTSDVSPQPNNLRFDHPHMSVGAGVRYDTPAGPIRLDVGYRVPGLQVLGGLTPDERKPDELFGIPIAVHIGIGEAY